MNAIVYDCEVERALPPPDGIHLEGIEYAQGWRDFDALGVSVIATYDCDAERYQVFARDNFAGFGALMASADLRVGFNIARFDDPLLRATLPERFAPPRGQPYFDLLEELWRSLGCLDQEDWDARRGTGLDATARANGLPGKIGRGDLAPVLWQRGQIGEVVNYCLHDVWLTQKLFYRLSTDEGLLRNPRAPEEWLKLREPNWVAIRQAALAKEKGPG